MKREKMVPFQQEGNTRGERTKTSFASIHSAGRAGLHRTAKATSERLDVVKRARALLAVQAGQSFTEAAREAGYKSGDSVRQWRALTRKDLWGCSLHLDADPSLRNRGSSRRASSRK